MTDRDAPVAFQQQSWENATELVERFSKMGEVNRRVANVEVGQTPSEVVYTENKLELLHYSPEDAGIDVPEEDRHDVPVLFVYALFNKPFILDLQPDKSVIRRFLEHGFDVYMIDWNEPSLLDHALTFENYVDGYLDNCVDVVRERSGQDDLNLFGYCMGGTMSVLYAALYPEKVRNLVLMATAVCLYDTGSVVDQWVGDDRFDLEALTDAYGNVPAEYLDMAFTMREPVNDTVTKYMRFFDGMDDEEFVENFARMERWVDESIDVPGQFILEFLEAVYREEKLYNNEMHIGGRHADLRNLDMPVAQIIGNYDSVVPPEAPRQFTEALPGDVDVFEADTGHMGLAVSGSSHANLWPAVCEWYADNLGPAAVDAIDGIGPAYAERLRAVGIESVADLAAVEPTDLAAETDLSETRLTDWVARARDRTA